MAALKQDLLKLLRNYNKQFPDVIADLEKSENIIPPADFINVTYLLEILAQYNPDILKESFYQSCKAKIEIKPQRGRF